MTIFFVILILIIFSFIAYIIQRKGERKKLERAQNLYKEGKYEEALKLFNTIRKREIGNRLLDWYVGMCHEALKNYELALAEYNKVALSTKFPPPLQEVIVHEKIAILNFSIGNIKKAYHEFLIITSLSPDNARAYYYLGIISRDKGELQKGVEFLEKAASTKKDFPQALLEAGKLHYQLNHTDEAKRSLVEAISQDPNLTEAHFYYALILEKERSYEKSAEEFYYAMRDERLKFESYVHLGLIYMEMGNKDTGFDFFEKALQTGTPDEKALLYAKYRYAGCLVQSGNLNRAMKLWKEIYAVQPQYMDVEQQIRVYEEISKSENLTRFITSVERDFLNIGTKVCSLLDIKVDRQISLKDDFIEFKGSTRIGRDEISCLVHVVKWTNPVGEIPVRELLERMVDEGASKGIFITPSNFTEKAQDLAKIRPLELVQREMLEKLLARIY